MQHLKKIKLIPCGHSIGLHVLKKEFTVEDYIPVLKSNGLYHFPAREAGIRVGDVIVRIQGKIVKSEQQIAQIVNSAGDKHEVELTIRRNNETFTTHVKPFYMPSTKSYKLGIKLRALTTGLGTLTFYDPETQFFGAVGHYVPNIPDHGVTDIILPANVDTIIKGRPLNPGQKLGYLISNKEFTATILYNTPTGIFGILQGKIKNSDFPEPIPVAAKKDIKCEPAFMYTVISGGQIERFAVTIEKVDPLEDINKDISISLKDEELMRRTGGFIQGMSGSPIVQDGKLIGALSFLSFRDCKKGYAVSMENMLQPVLGDHSTLLALTNCRREAVKT